MATAQRNRSPTDLNATVLSELSTKLNGTHLEEDESDSFGSYASFDEESSLTSNEISSNAKKDCIQSDEIVIPNKQQNRDKEHHSPIEVLKSDQIPNEVLEKLIAFVFILGQDENEFSIQNLEDKFQMQFEDRNNDIDIVKELQKLNIVTLKYAKDEKNVLMTPTSKFLEDYANSKRRHKVNPSNVKYL